MPEVVLRTRYCHTCGAVFCICSHCDRGQCYCGPACRREARQQQLRAANRRYQQTDGGQRLHRMRQRGYRLRKAEGRVTDHGSCLVVRPRPIALAGLGNCAVCGRHSRWIDPFAAIPRSRKPQRRPTAVGKRSHFYVFR
jgi:hypothetical protein